MLGLTGASGAPYAARVLRALADAGADVGVVASRAGRQVIALECYGDREMDPAGTLERLPAGHGRTNPVTATGTDDAVAVAAAGARQGGGTSECARGRTAGCGNSCPSSCRSRT